MLQNNPMMQPQYQEGHHEDALIPMFVEKFVMQLDCVCCTLTHRDNPCLYHPIFGTMTIISMENSKLLKNSRLSVQGHTLFDWLHNYVHAQASTLTKQKYWDTKTEHWLHKSLSITLFLETFGFSTRAVTFLKILILNYWKPSFKDYIIELDTPTMDRSHIGTSIP